MEVKKGQLTRTFLSWLVLIRRQDSVALFSLLVYKLIEFEKGVQRDGRQMGNLLKNQNYHVSSEKIADYCKRWRITEFALFGSILRDDFGPESDIDALITFDKDSHWTLFDLVAMQEELKQIFGRQVDLVSRRGIESSQNYLRRTEILSSAKVIHGTR